MDNTFARRLINARIIRCMSQQDLCSKLDDKVSLDTLQKYEMAQMMPSEDVLILLMRALGFNMDYFFRPFEEGVDIKIVLIHTCKYISKSKEEALLNIISYELEKHIEIERILGILNSYKLEEKNMIVRTEEDVKTIAQLFRKELNIGKAGISSVIELLETVGIKVVEIDTDKDFLSGYAKLRGIPYILVNKNLTPEKKRNEVFYQIGNFLMNFADGVDTEYLSSLFALEVLIPSEMLIEFIGDSRQDISLMELKSIQRQIGVDIDSLMLKAALSGIITDAKYLDFCKRLEDFPHFKEKVEESLISDEGSSRFERMVYRALASEMITISKAASLLECSVNEIRNNLVLL